MSGIVPYELFIKKVLKLIPAPKQYSLLPLLLTAYKNKILNTLLLKTQYILVGHTEIKLELN